MSIGIGNGAGGIATTWLHGDASGNVGIGTTGPMVRLHVKSNTGNADIATESSDGFKWTMSTGIGGNWILNRNIPGDLPTIIVDQAGRVGIGASSPAPGDKLDVAGDIQTGDLANGALGCVRRRDGAALVGACSSDQRLKKNITPLTKALEKVIALQPVNFEWKVEDYPDRQFGAGKMFGLIADDVEKVLPELVATDKEGYKTVSYGARASDAAY